MERSRSEIKSEHVAGTQTYVYAVRENRRSFYVLDAAGNSTLSNMRLQPMRKSNSCSTIYLDDSTISQPNMKNTIKCISLAIYYHIVHRKNRNCERLIDIFEERAHPISVSVCARVRAHFVHSGRCTRRSCTPTPIIEAYIDSYARSFTPHS
jgi:hypothetical protein